MRDAVRGDDTSGLRTKDANCGARGRDKTKYIDFMKFQDSTHTCGPARNTKHGDLALSIITVNYNSGLLLRKTLTELRCFADHSSIELIVVDGDSTDESKEVIIENGNYVTRFISEGDKGIYDAMNKGIRISRGNWLWFVNSGDIPSITPDEIICVINCADEKAANYIYSDLPVGRGVLRQNLGLVSLATGTINHQNAIYRKELLVDGYDVSYRYCADYSHLLKAYRMLRPFKADSMLCIYDCNGLTSESDRSRRISLWTERLRAQITSPLNMAVKCVFVFISLSAILVKFINPVIGRRRIPR